MPESPVSPFLGASVKSGGQVSLGPISGLRELNFWDQDPKQGDQANFTLTAVQAYARVPWMFRAVNLRANTAADIPWSILKGKTEIITSDKDDERIGSLPPELAWIKPVGAGTKGADPTQDSLPDLIRKTEMDLCLSGSAYWKADRNRVRTLGYRRWLPSTIRPQYDPKAGLTGFIRTVPGAANEESFQISDLVFWWLPSAEAELGPGEAPAVVALRAAGLMSNIDTYSEGFFGRGAINTTILTVEGNPQDAELRRLELWWKRLLGGVRRAFETVAVRASIKPVVVGQAPKDLALDTLTQAKRRDVAVALGVPASILDDESANFATAKVSLLNFYRLTMLPECELIESGLNRQVFAPLGYEFRYHPEKLEALEEEESSKAYKLLALVVGSVITPNEMREEMAYEPIEGGDVLRPVVALGPTDQSGSPHTDGAAANGTLGSSPRTDRQAQRQLAGAVRPTEGSPLHKALDVAAWADVVQALMPEKPAVKAGRTHRTIERDDEGRIVGVTEDSEADVETFNDGQPYP